LWNLWENTNACVASATNNTGFGVILARQKTQQGALAATIKANNTKSIASTHGDRDIVE
jgi:hypothetical protein